MAFIEVLYGFVDFLDVLLVYFLGETSKVAVELDQLAHRMTG